jgi:hypothetical protein
MIEKHKSEKAETKIRQHIKRGQHKERENQAKRNATQRQRTMLDASWRSSDNAGSH